MKNIKVKNLGPIKEANIEFGNLTILVGPQASGKSILLQMIKLIIDKKYIRSTFDQYGFIWANKEKEILDRYFGEGMSGIWDNRTRVSFDGRPYLLKNLLPKKGEISARLSGEKLFYVPAQRVVCLQNGWPRFFTDYEDSVPFVLRDFSETLRQFLESGISDSTKPIFPQLERLKEQSRNSFNNSIFHKGKISVDKAGKKRFKLDIGKSSIPFMAWSAGQKEFMPLLLSFYWLCPSSRISKRPNVDYVIIEEPEMGLHPQAIQSVLLQVMDLMARGYKVIISTHSPVLLEFAWAVEHLQKNKADYKSLAELFDLEKNRPSVKKMLISVMNSSFKAYYFNRINNGVFVKDISSLDAGSEDEAVSDWGGLASFSSKASEIVLKFANEE